MTYEGANIVALDWCYVPSRHQARIWLPAAIQRPEDTTEEADVTVVEVAALDVNKEPS